MNLSKLLVTGFAFCVLPMTTFSAPPDDDLLLNKAQGTWELQKGDEFRMVMTIKGREKITSRYRGDKLLYRYTSELSITTTEKLALLTYEDMRLIEGDGPETVKGPFSHILKFRDEKARDGTVVEMMILAGGLLKDDETAPRLLHYRRIARPKN